MKTMTKKLGSVVLALCLCFSLCCTAFAASGNGGSITINNAAVGETYTIYQIFDLTYADDKSSYSYKVTDAWAAFFAEGAAGAEYVTLDSDGYVTANTIEGNEQAFAKAALAYAEKAEITGTKEEVAESSTVVFEGLPLGYYLVDTTLGSLCALTNTEPDADISEKNPTPSITKEIFEDDYTRKEKDEEFDDDNGHFEENVDGDGWGTWDDADNNQTIVYHLTLTDINGALNLTVHDYLETGLDFTKIESIVLYKDSSDKDGTLLVEETDFILTQGTCSDPACQMDACTFEVHFVSETEEGYTGLTRLFDDLTDEAYLVITYDALTNTHAGDYTDYEDDILNHAYLTYGTASYSTVTTTETELFGFGVYKYTVNENDEKTALANAEFTLSKETSDGVVYATFTTETSTTDGSTYYMISGWVSDASQAGKLISGSDGMIRIEGLDDDTYYLQETEAPEGYNLLSETIIVVIGEDGGITVNGEGASKDSSIAHQVNVENKSGTELPGTGGIGTTIFYIIGGVLVAGAVVVLITRRRMSHEA